jgi:hypothetical protein
MHAGSRKANSWGVVTQRVGWRTSPSYSEHPEIARGTKLETRESEPDCTLFQDTVNALGLFSGALANPLVTHCSPAV